MGKCLLWPLFWRTAIQCNAKNQTYKKINPQVKTVNLTHEDMVVSEYCQLREQLCNVSFSRDLLYVINVQRIML